MSLGTAFALASSPWPFEILHSLLEPLHACCWLPCLLKHKSPQRSNPATPKRNPTGPRLSPIFAQLPPKTENPQGPIPEVPPGDPDPRAPAEVLEAQPDQRSSIAFTDRRFQLETRVGIDTSVGEVGLVGEYNLFERLAIGAGFGTNTLGPEWGVHVRLRPIVGTSSSGRRLHAFTVETALSRGQYAGTIDVLPSLGPCMEGDTSGCPTERSAEWMTWLQFELGWETRAEYGFSLRLSSGYAMALNAPAWKCTVLGKAVTCDKSSGNADSTTFTVGVGYAW